MGWVLFAIVAWAAGWALNVWLSRQGPGLSWLIPVILA